MKYACYIMAVGSWAAVVFGHLEFSAMLTGILLLGAALLLERFERSHRVSYDSDAIYIRPGGLTWTIDRRPEHVIPFSAIGSVWDEPPTRADRARSLAPGKLGYVRIRRSDGDPDGDVRFDVQSHVKNDVRALLCLIADRHPGSLAPPLARWSLRE